MSRRKWSRVGDSLLEFEPEAIRVAAGDEEDGEQGRMICRALRRAWEESLTPCQKKYMKLYYRDRMSIYEIASQENVLVSTVSRTLARGRSRLYAILKYYIL